jgi:hypothetical protein
MKNLSPVSVLCNVNAVLVHVNPVPIYVNPVPVYVSATPIYVNAAPISHCQYILFEKSRAIRQTRPIFYQQAESTSWYGDHKARCGDLGPDYCGICSWLKWRWIVALDPTWAC